MVVGGEDAGYVCWLAASFHHSLHNKQETTSHEIGSMSDIGSLPFANGALGNILSRLLETV